MGPSERRAPPIVVPLGLPIAVLLALAAADPALASDPEPESPFLHVVQLTISPGADVDLHRPLRIEIHADDPAALAHELGEISVSAGPDSLVLDLTRYPVLAPAEPGRYLAPSFVNDFDAAAVATLHDAATARYGPAPSPEDLVGFVRETITPAGGRGFNIASQVAVHREGDCTEHAVLFTSLARSVGIPTRIAVGMVIVAADEGAGAFGHAWAEVHDAAGWRPVDPTDIEGGEPVAYLPEGLLENEGPGYAMGLIRILSHGIERIEILGNAP